MLHRMAARFSSINLVRTFAGTCRAVYWLLLGTLSSNLSGKNTGCMGSYTMMGEMPEISSEHGHGIAVVEGLPHQEASLA